MATYGRTLRRGLPRRAGGDPWPAGGDAPIQAAAGVAEAAAAVETSVTPPVGAVPSAAVLEAGAVTPAPAETTSSAAASTVAAASAPAGATPLRRGLPRVAGGEPWPPETTTSSASAASSAPSLAPAADETSVTRTAPPAAADFTTAAPADRPAVVSPAAAPSLDAGVELRRGLPRVPGGEPWPPAGTVSAAAPAPASAPALAEPAAAESAPAASVAGAPAATAAPAAEVAVTSGPREPLAVPRSVWPGRAATVRPAPKPEPQRIGPFTKAQWAGIVIVGGGGLLVAAALAVLFVRVLLSMPFGQDFLAAFPGEYHLPEGAPVGFPAWLGWQHFFNVFLMVLIIRSGLTIRTEKRPTVFWAPRKDPKGKTSLTIWFHQSLDVLWLVNGVVFVVLLFVTGQWMRIVPTSWEVFPNALSALLQYVSLDWPTENGWVNYNSLQQLAYFTTVFLAAPLAAVTGYRMSGMWPRNNARLSRAYPVEWARKVHFPVMLYFVVFIAIHVLLVFATGALRNLNHMYAAQGSVDGVAYADNWAGFWFFVASLVVIAGAWIAARPLTLAPIARLFGTVSGR